jgi:hypothetical protein
MEKKKIEEALEELTFIDEPDLDIGLLSLSILSGCIKHCQAGHCGGQTDDCKKQRMCDDKCLGLGGCIKQSRKWCSHQTDDCDKGICSNKCAGRGIF